MTYLAGLTLRKSNYIPMLTALLLTTMIQQDSYKVEPHWQDVSTQYTQKQGLPSDRVQAIILTGDYVWAATESGLARLKLNAKESDRWEKLNSERYTALHADGRTGAYAIANQGVVRVDASGKSQPLKGLEKVNALQLLRVGPDGLLCLTRDKLYLWDDEILASYEPPTNRQYLWMARDTKGRTFVSCEGELERWLYRLIPGLGEKTNNQETWHKIGIADNRGRFIDDVFYCAVGDTVGYLWLGTRSGLLLTDGDGWWLPYTGKDGLPYEDVRTLALAQNGSLWAGTQEGVCRLHDGKWSYFQGKRWLPGNQVRGVTVDSENRAWIATDQGVARIESVKMTLAQKAEHYERITGLRHNRNGFVTICEFDDPDNLETWKIEASDNDGLWTAVYCAAQCYQYAATKDPQAKTRAQKSIRAIMDLERLTGISGFHARSIIRKGETRYFQSSGEWHESPVDPSYIWKGDTSSDEIDGHYFVYAVYYDLVADEKEKEQIRAVVRRATDHLMQNNWRLIDKDGKPTRWAIFNPEAINDDPIWEEERGLNSLSILAHLKATYHITGDTKYQQAYEELIKKHRYLINAVTQKISDPFPVNHSDDQLAFLCYYLLIYETDPVYRRIWMMSLERSWQIERPERSPLFNFIYGAVSGQPCDLAESVRTLREWPLDLRNWQMRNSHRSDVKLDMSKGRFNEAQSVQIVPYSERTLMMWNGNPYRLDGGDPTGRREDDGGAFLLPYWMGRYYKFIVE
jgi:hypothetical protein